MKEIYIVKWSQGSYDDYKEDNKKIAYVSIEAAEKAKKDLEELMQPLPFPFNWCTQEEFEELVDNDKAKQEDMDLFYHLDNENYFKGNFGKAWVETLQLDIEDLRDTKIKSILDV